MTSKVFHSSVQIYYEDTDHSGVVYHPNFLKYFERAREHVIGSGLLAQLWNEEGLGFAVYKADSTFQDGVEFADVCDIRSSFSVDGPYRTLWHQELWRPNAKRAAVIAEIQMVCMGKDKQLKHIPQVVLDLLD
ncbi:MAG: thioesterase family protein [Pseudomonadota bacterium]